jgi:hypothetical protein
VHEVVIVLADLYFAQAPEPEAQARAFQNDAHDALSARVRTPGLDHLARFGSSQPLGRDWRSWIAGWLAAATGGGSGGADAPATVAARTLTTPLPADATVWFATPVHLLAGLSSVHLERSGLLQLDAAEAVALAAGFARVFDDSGFVLCPLPTGELLLRAPPMAIASTVEPARCVAREVTAGLPQGPGDAALRRLTAELEMWLHDLPLNEARRARGALPITALWLWGGGPTPTGAPAGVHMRREPHTLLYGRDSWLAGITGLNHEILPVPEELTPLFSYSQAQRALLVLRSATELAAHPRESLPEVLQRWDERFFFPAVAALRRGALTAVTILANDRAAQLRAHDRFRFWRRARSGLAAFD